MIETKAELKYYLERDQISMDCIGRKPALYGDMIWKFQIAMRHAEYHTNQCRRSGRKSIVYFYWKAVYYHYSIKLGFDIPLNVFGPGLNIHHFGNIVVNGNARVGENCTLQQGVNIGAGYAPDEVPHIGNNVTIMPGAKIFGKIEIADGITIGANAVVNKSFKEPGVVIAGIPAQIIKRDRNIVSTNETESEE